MAEWDFIVAPSDLKFDVAINQTLMSIHSLALLNMVDDLSGLGEWVVNTATKMSKEQKRSNQLVGGLFDSAPDVAIEMSFIEFIEGLEQLPASDIRDMVTKWCEDFNDLPEYADSLTSEENYIRFVEAVNVKKEKDDPVDYEYARWFYQMVQHPEALKSIVTAHLRMMWRDYLQQEWKRQERLLREVQNALRDMNFNNMDAYDAIEAVTGRNMRGKNSHLNTRVEKAREIVFIPSPHVGPYIGWLPSTTQEEKVVILFGARLPQNAKATPSGELSRSELLVRLNALADDTRLQILELLIQNEEMCAQDFINDLNLSQSSASRHLRQLTASGYLHERRKDVAKCYTINHDRFEDTIKALRNFIKTSP